MPAFFILRAGVTAASLSTGKPLEKENTTMADDQGIELTAEEAAAERAKMADTIFGDEGTTDADSLGTTHAAEEGHKETPPAEEGADKGKKGDAKPDEWESVPQAIREQFADMAEKVKSLTVITERLKQAESRIGSLTNEAAKAKKEAEALKAKEKEAPTQEQIDAAAQSEARWKELEKEFPEWAGAIEDRFKKEQKTFSALEQKIDDLQKEIASGKQTVAETNTSNNEVRELKMAMIALKHPEWEKTKVDKDFQAFANSTEQYQKWRDSENPLESIALLDAYAEKVNKSNGGKTIAQIEEERKRRLKQSQTPDTGWTKRTLKSDDDMSDAEYRSREGKRLYETA